MGNFNRGDKFSGKKRFGGDRGFGQGDRSERPTMHRATCADCGKSCEVPFRPSGDKPVFCSDCFGRKEGGNNNRFERRDSGRGDKQMFQATCDKCHKSCEVPFRPTGDKPVFCSDCFGKGEKNNGGNNAPIHDQYKKQFETLNAKLDSILKMLPLQNTKKEIIKEEKPVMETTKKATKKKTVAPKKAAKKVPAKKKKK
jgi:CxxC-x17-CxxC domain-containing protein